MLSSRGMRALCTGLRETVGHVADDPVDAPADEAAHDLDVVDGPREDVQPLVVRVANQIGAYQRPVRMNGDGAQCPRPLPGLGQLGRLPKQPELNIRAHGSCGLQRPRLEARDDRRFETPTGAQDTDELLGEHRPVVGSPFHLHIQTRTVADEPEDVRQSQQPLARETRPEPAPRIETLQVLPRMRAHGTVAVGGPVERRIMDHDELVVTAQLHVQLDHVDAQAQRLLKRSSRMLRRARRRAAVRDAQPPRRHRRSDRRCAPTGQADRARAPGPILHRPRALCDTSPVPQTWFELTVEVPHPCSEAVANFLIESGSPGLQSEERADAVVLTAYFASDPPLDAVRRFCTAIGCASDHDVSMQVRQVADEDWGHNWKRHFVPLPIGRRLYVCPSWDALAPPGRVGVVIDPGMAFGTGQHPSTRGCLELLERRVAAGGVTRALDVGTGSGVLAIALAKLGVGDVCAVDTDPAACAIAAANARQNGVGTVVHMAPSLDAVSGAFELIAANLFANVLQALAPRLTAMLRPSGVVICSGLLTEDEARVCTAYESLGLRRQDRYEENSWVTLALQRPGAR